MNRRTPTFRKSSQAAAAFLVLLTLGLPARAAFLTITNPGFDAILSQNLVDNQGTHPAGTDIPQNYYARFDAGASNPLTVHYENISTGGTMDASTGINATLAGWAPTGSTTVYTGVQNPGEINVGNVGELTDVFGSTATLSQTLPGAVTFQPNTTYQLSIQLFDKGAPTVNVASTFSADLTVGGTPLGLVQHVVLPTVSTPGSDTVFFTTGATPPTGVIGIQLNVHDASGISQMLVDNVTLQTIPEPAALLLGGWGCLVLLGTSWRRKLAPGRRQVAAVLLVLAALGPAVSANAASLTITNPGFDATLDQGFTDQNNPNPGSNFHAAGTDVPQNYYARFSAGAGQPLTVYYEHSTTGGIADNPVGVTATMLGWTPGPVSNRTGIQNPSETFAGDHGELTTVNNQGGAQLSQTLPGNVSFLPNTTYVLTVELLTKGLFPTAPLTADLTHGGTPLGLTQNITLPTTSTPGSDVVTFTTGAVAPTGAIGILFSIPNESDIEQVLIDNVTLRTIPEPASMVLCGLGALALVGSVLCRKAGKR